MTRGLRNGSASGDDMSRGADRKLLDARNGVHIGGRLSDVVWGGEVVDRVGGEKQGRLGQRWGSQVIAALSYPVV